MKHEDYNRIVAKILELFPNEASGTYYIPAISKCDSPAGVSQKTMGKLPNRVRNIRFRSGDTKKTKSLKEPVACKKLKLDGRFTSS